MLITHTADWHLQQESPRCRTDEDWKKTMTNMISFIVLFSIGKNSNLINVGDIFNGTQMPHWVVNMYLDLVDSGYIYAGNHDFKHRNLENITYSAIGHLLKNPKYIPCVPDKDDGFFSIEDDIVLCHRLVYPPESAGLAKFKRGISVDDLIELAREEYPDVKWILLGDNHHKFHYVSDEGVHVVNPGSPLIYNASMKDEECGFYFIDTEKEIVKFIRVPDDPDLVTDKYLQEEKDLTKSIEESMVLISGEGDSESIDFFHINDNKAKAMDSEFRNIYEDIKNETLGIRSREGV